MGEAENEVSLDDMTAAAHKAAQRKVERPETQVKKLVETASLPDQKPVGGRPKVVKQKNEQLTDQDYVVLEKLAGGETKVQIAKDMGISRQEVYRILNSDRVQRIVTNARLRLESLQDLAVEVLHKELLKENAEVATQILKGLGTLKQNSGTSGNGVKKRTTLEKILDRNSGTETQRVIREEGE